MLLEQHYLIEKLIENSLVFCFSGIEIGDRTGMPKTKLNNVKISAEISHEKSAVY